MNFEQEVNKKNRLLCYAPINVKPLGGGRPGIGGGFDVTGVPVVGTFDYSLSSFDQQ